MDHDERRASERYRVWLPVSIDELSDGMAVTHDASARGVLIVTATELAVGSVIHLRVRSPASTTEHRVDGKVVRVERNQQDPGGIWPYQVAVEFEDPAPDIEPLIRSLQQRSAAHSRRDSGR